MGVLQGGGGGGRGEALDPPCVSVFCASLTASVIPVV